MTGGSLEIAYNYLKTNLENWYENELEIREDLTAHEFVQNYMSGGFYAPVRRMKPEAWLQCGGWKNYRVLDPDGWDRSNFEESWNEPISSHEMGRRLAKSTIQIIENNS